MELSSETRLSGLLKKYPFLVDFLAGWNPGYAKLRNPLLRRTVGRLATLKEVAAMGGVPVEELLAAVASEVRRVSGRDVTGAPATNNKKKEGTEMNEKKDRKEALKRIIRELHAGRSAEELQPEFMEKLGDVAASEIAAMEQELIAEGMPEEEIKKLCDLHVRVFEAALDKKPPLTKLPGHPLHTLSAENAALQGLLAEAGELLKSVREGEAAGWPALKSRLAGVMESLREVEKHYLKKENQLFPFLEARGASGPSKVMWAIHDDIRAHLKKAARSLERDDRGELAQELGLALKAMSDMIYKEEKILFPMSEELLQEADWARVKKGEEEIGYAWVKPGSAWRPSVPESELPRAHAYGKPEPDGGGARGAGGPAAGRITLDTGSLTPEQVNLMLLNLPLDVSFVDETDTVVYYSANKERIFTRTPGVIGRKVQNCHPPKSVHIVNRILETFRKGEKDSAEFWIQMRGRFLHIRYFALRDGSGAYRGCLEVTQDVTGIRALEGERRLLDWS